MQCRGLCFTRLLRTLHKMEGGMRMSAQPAWVAWAAIGWKRLEPPRPPPGGAQRTCLLHGKGQVLGATASKVWAGCSLVAIAAAAAVAGRPRTYN